MNATLEKATFGGGCFWCTEAIFKQAKGVTQVTPGYAGGTAPNPTYEQVCTGTTGHAEIVQIEYDPNIIPYQTLVQIFFATHDPTQLNRQGNDIGEQYRSVIFFHDDQQRKTAENIIAQLKKEKIYSEPIVTQIKPLEHFFPAEDYHRDYFIKNGEQPYCQAVISPKLAKFRKTFQQYLK